MIAYPDVDDVKAWLGLDDVYDDVVLDESLQASIVAQSRVVRYPVDDVGEEILTDDLELALFLRTQRLAARRNSPEGVVGLTGVGGDFVGARVPTGDPDVLRLEGPYLRIPVA